MIPDQDEEKASKSGLPAMFTRNYQNPLGPNPGPENQNRGPFSEQQTDETPRWHGAMEVVWLPSATHAGLAASEASARNWRRL